MKQWKLTELKFIRENLHLTDVELSNCFNVSEKSLKATRKRHRILRPSNTWHFQVGSVPFNKGKEYNAGGKSVETRFKKGHTSPNVRPIGEVFIRTDGDGHPYKYIKTKTCRQYSYPRYVWEKEHREKLTKSDVIRYKDGNSLNCDPSNLIKITRAENVKLNTNRDKAAKEMRNVWAVVRTFEDFGLTPPYKFKSKRKRA